MRKQNDDFDGGLAYNPKTEHAKIIIEGQELVLKKDTKAKDLYEKPLDDIVVTDAGR